MELPSRKSVERAGQESGSFNPGQDTWPAPSLIRGNCFLKQHISHVVVQVGRPLLGANPTCDASPP